MSKESLNTNVCATLEKNMVLTEKDAETVEKFFTHFKIGIPEKLQVALDEFKNEQTLETQKALATELNKSVCGEDSPLLKLDPLFKPIVDYSDKAAYELQFNQDIEDEFSVDDSNPQGSSESED